MNYLKRSLFITMLIFMGMDVSAQVDILTDSKGEPLFSIPSLSLTPKLSSKNIGFNTPLWILSKQEPYVLRGRGPDTFTVKKTMSFNIGLNVVENSKNTLIFSKNTNITPSVELGFQNTLDEISRADLLAGFYYTFSGSVFLKYQSLKWYNLQNQSFSIDRFEHLVPGVKGTFNLFWRKNMAVALTGTYQKAANIDKLTPYQFTSDVIYSDANVVTNGKSEGYLGPIQADHLWRLSTSLPIFVIKGFATNQEKTRFLQLVPTPYYFVSATPGSEPSHNAGFAISFLSGNMHSDSFSFVDGLSISYNILNTGDTKNARFLFLNGTFSFGKSKPKTNTNITEKNIKNSRQ